MSKHKDGKLPQGDKWDSLIREYRQANDWQLKTLSQVFSYANVDSFQRAMRKRGIKRTMKVSTPEKPDNSKEQLMICPKARECPYQSITCKALKPHALTEVCYCTHDTKIRCGRYEPEKEWEKNPVIMQSHISQPEKEIHIKFTREETAFEIINGYIVYTPPKLHPASKVIEKGYFGIHAFVQVPTWAEIPSKGWAWQDWYTFYSSR